MNGSWMEGLGNPGKSGVKFADALDRYQYEILNILTGGGRKFASAANSAQLAGIYYPTDPNPGSAGTPNFERRKAW